MPSIPTPGVAKSTFHWGVDGLYQRNDNSSSGPSDLNSAILARPSQIFFTTVTPVISTQSFDPLKGCNSRQERSFHLPKLKWKSCEPSRSLPAFTPASPGVPAAAAVQANPMRARQTPEIAA